MLQLIGIKKHVDIHIREQLTLLPKKQKQALHNLSEMFDEVIILSTCNRTEIYINHKKDINEYKKEIFSALAWPQEYKQYCFIEQDEMVVNHLMEVTCGFHSRIIGEDQILGQIKVAYQNSIENKCIGSILKRLFEEALSCGKKFKTESQLCKIPVSASSISVSKSFEHGVNKVVVIGYGEVGELVVKYALGYKFKEIYIVTRDKTKINNINDERVKIINYKQMKEIINNVDGIISCTASPHIIISKDDVHDIGNNLIVFDLAVPRDIDKSIKAIPRVKLYDIDDIGVLDNKNKQLRLERMNEYKYITEDYSKEFINWIKIRDISSYIKDIKSTESRVVNERMLSFSNKCKSQDDIELANTLRKSTSDYYVNKAIEVLKEAKIKGCEDECLEIIKKVFCQ